MFDYRFPYGCMQARFPKVPRRCYLNATPMPVTMAGGKDVPVNKYHPSRARRWLSAAVKLLIVALVVWYVRRTLVDAWEQLGERRWQFDLGWLTLSGALYLLGTLLCGLFWHRALLALGQQVSLSRALLAYYIVHLGKYVPGKAMVVILRAGLVRGQGIDAALAAVSVFFETLTMMSTGALMAAAIVAFWFREQRLLFWAALAIVVVAGAPTLPPVFRRLVRLVGVGKTNPVVAENWPNSATGRCFSDGC